MNQDSWEREAIKWKARFELLSDLYKRETGIDPAKFLKDERRKNNNLIVISAGKKGGSHDEG